MAKFYQRARRRAFQALFEAEFGRVSALHALQRAAGSANLPRADVAYAEALVIGVARERAQLDQIVTDTAPIWPVDQISIVDRTVLRIALYELLFNNAAVPPGAVINEAIELAKAFGSEASRRFVNGVLGTVSRERLGTPAGRRAETEEPGGPV